VLAHVSRHLVVWLSFNVRQKTMSYIDPIDALDGSPVRPQSWLSVVERYSATPTALHLVRLAKAIALGLPRFFGHRVRVMI